jgi:signal transduction histidine kinase
MARSRLVVWYLVSSLAAVAVATALFGGLAGEYLTRRMLDREQRVTVAYVERVVAGELPVEQLRALSSAGVGASLGAVAEGLLRLPEAVRVKVFDGRGTVVWSDAAGIVGQNFAADPNVQRSLQGRAVIALERMDPRPEHTTETGRYDELTCVYVPIRDPEHGVVLAVFEIYKLPDVLLASLRGDRRVLWGLAVGVGTLLSLAQLALVWRAARTIDRQHVELGRRAGALQDANAELRAAQERIVARERLAAVGETAVAVAHGLSNPLASIRALAQESSALLGKNDPDAARPAVEEIVGQVDRLAARLRALLASTRPLPLDRQATTPREVIDEAVRGVRHRLDSAGVRVSVQGADVGRAVSWDTVTMQQVVQELLVNALEAGARRIEITVAADDGAVLVTVRDDGAGLAPSVQARAFEPFVTAKPEGTGMGLAMVRRVAEAHGGRAAIAPAPAGAGTVVTLRLPVAG